MINPYETLNIPVTASKDDIKKAYLTMVKKYHPDRCGDDPTTEQKIKDIYMAYNILNNIKHKQEYDTLNDDDKKNYYSEFKKIFSRKFPILSDFVKKFMLSAYESEDSLQRDFDNFDFTKIYDTVIKKVPNVVSEFNFTNAPAHYAPRDKNELNIYGSIRTSIKNKYFNRYEKILVSRITREDIYIYVPLREKQYTINNEGETYNQISGDIVIDIVCDDEENIYEYGNNIIYYYDVGLYEYLYGGNINIKYFDNDIIMTYESMINNVPVIEIEEKGLPYIEENALKRGKLMIKLLIRNINNNIVKSKINLLDV